MLMKRLFLSLGIALSLGVFALMQYEEIFGLPLFVAWCAGIALCAAFMVALVRTWQE